MKLIFLEDNGKPITSCSSSDQNIKFRAILFVENETGGFNCYSPVKVTRWLNIDRIFSEVHLNEVSCSLFELSEGSRSIFRKSKESIQIQQDALLAKNISLCYTPLEYIEVEDMVDQKIEAKTHNYLYLVKFKNENDNIWIPGHNFLDQVQYDRRKMNKNQKQFALQPLTSVLLLMEAWGLITLLLKSSSEVVIVDCLQ